MAAVSGEGQPEGERLAQSPGSSGRPSEGQYGDLGDLGDFESDDITKLKVRQLTSLTLGQLAHEGKLLQVFALFSLFDGAMGSELVKGQGNLLPVPYMAINWEAGYIVYAVILLLLVFGACMGAAMSCLVTWWWRRRHADPRPPELGFEERRLHSEKSIKIYITRDSKVYHTETSCKSLQGYAAPRDHRLCNYCASKGTVSQGSLFKEE